MKKTCITVSLEPDEVAFIDNLVEKKFFSSRSAAVRVFVRLQMKKKKLEVPLR